MPLIHTTTKGCAICRARRRGHRPLQASESRMIVRVLDTTPEGSRPVQKPDASPDAGRQGACAAMCAAPHAALSRCCSFTFMRARRPAHIGMDVAFTGADYGSPSY